METKNILQEVRDKTQDSQARQLPCIWKKAEQSCDVSEAMVCRLVSVMGGHASVEVGTVM